MHKYSVLITDHEAGLTIYEFCEATDPAHAVAVSMRQYYEDLHPQDYPTHTVELVIAGHHTSLHGG